MPTYARDALLDRLKLVQPALAKTDFVPLLQSVFFTPQGMLAYNDQLGILAPLADCPQLAVPGLPLIRLLDAGYSREVSLDIDGDRLRVRSGGMRASFPADIGEPPLRWPAMPTEGLDVTPDLLLALKLALRVADPRNYRLQARGVTILPYDEATLGVYATDGPSMLRVLVPGALGEARSTVLPSTFVEQLVKHSDGTGRLGFGETLVGSAYAMFEADDIAIFAKLIIPDPPLDFEAVLGNNWPQSFAMVPEGFEQALDRAAVIADQSVEDDALRTRVEILHGQLTLTTRSPMGEVFDEFPTEHPPARLTVDCKRLTRMVGQGPDQFGIATGALMLASELVAYITVGKA